MFGMVLQHDRGKQIKYQVTRFKAKVIISHKQTSISSAIAMNVFKVDFLLNIPTVEEKRELHVEFCVKR